MTIKLSQLKIVHNTDLKMNELFYQNLTENFALFDILIFFALLKHPKLKLSILQTQEH